MIYNLLIVYIKRSMNEPNLVLLLVDNLLGESTRSLDWLIPNWGSNLSGHVFSDYSEW